MCRGSQRHGAEGSQVTRRQNPRHPIQQGPHHPTPAVKYRAGIAVASPSPASESPPVPGSSSNRTGTQQTQSRRRRREERGEGRRAAERGNRGPQPLRWSLLHAGQSPSPRPPSLFHPQPRLPLQSLLATSLLEHGRSSVLSRSSLSHSSSTPKPPPRLPPGPQSASHPSQVSSPFRARTPSPRVARDSLSAHRNPNRRVAARVLARDVSSHPPPKKPVTPQPAPAAAATTSRPQLFAPLQGLGPPAKQSSPQVCVSAPPNTAALAQFRRAHHMFFASRRKHHIRSVPGLSMPSVRLPLTLPPPRDNRPVRSRGRLADRVPPSRRFG